MNKLCCLLDPYKTCKWCKAKQCRNCLSKPQESIQCPRGFMSLANSNHYWVGGSILRSMPMRFK